MTNNAETCPICEGHPATLVVREPQRALTRFRCPACGEYDFVDQDDLINVDWKPVRHVLAGFIRRHNQLTGGPYRFEDRDDEGKLPADLLPTSVTEKIENTLLLVAERSASFGENASIAMGVDWALVQASSPKELRAITVHLQKQGLVEDKTPSGRTKGAPLGFMLTGQGWEQVERLRSGGTQNNRAFIAMSFAPEMLSAYEAIEGALRENHYEPIRVDRTEHNDKICDRILSEIRRAGLLVADVTNQRQGVYFEAGFGLGLGVPVLWSCHEDDFDKIHFDTRQYNHIRWTDPLDLKRKLSDRIRALYPRRA